MRDRAAVLCAAAVLAAGAVTAVPAEAGAVCPALPDPEPLGSKAASTSSRGSTLHGLLGFRG
ncbi:hypothetical protein [Streptomyces sp. NPDC087512]|uniref:hypothetical protein n=1 Tax=unclassified Streptomyces TaxID=2593676 RepID=UPI00343EC119